MKGKTFQHYSRLTDNLPSIAERVIESTRNLLKKPVFLVVKASWINEFQSVTKKFNKTFQNSIKMSPIAASRKSNEKEVHEIFRHDREIQRRKYKLGQIVRTADFRRVFSKGDNTNWSYQLYTKN